MWLEVHGVSFANVMMIPHVLVSWLGYSMTCEVFTYQIFQLGTTPNIMDVSVLCSSVRCIFKGADTRIYVVFHVTSWGILIFSRKPLLYTTWLPGEYSYFPGSDSVLHIFCRDTCSYSTEYDLKGILANCEQYSNPVILESHLYYINNSRRVGRLYVGMALRISPTVRVHTKAF